MIGQLIISGQNINLSENIPFPITFSIADVKDPQNRGRSSSKSTALPSTVNNMAFFSSAYQLSLTAITDGSDVVGFKFDPTQRLEAQYYEGGKLIFDGLIQLLSVDIINKNYSFNVALFSNFTQLFMALGQKKIAELGWNEYDHVLNNTNIQNSWDTSVIINGLATANFTAGVPDGVGYLYGLVDYGMEPNLLDFKNNNLFPSVYRKEVMKKCFAVAEQTISSVFFATERFKRMVLAFGGGAKAQISPTEVAARKTKYTGTGNYTTNIVYTSYSVEYPSLGGVPYNKYVYGFNQVLKLADNFWSATTIVNDTLLQLDETTGDITIARSGQYSINFNGVLAFTIAQVGTSISSLGSFGLNLRLYKNGYQIGSFHIATFAGTTTVTINTTLNISAIAGDLITVQFHLYVFPQLIRHSVEPPATAPYFTYQMANSVGPLTIDLVSLQAPVADGDTIYLTNYLPDITCAEFIKGVMTEYNLYVSDPDKDGVVKIEPLNDYYNATNVFDDWTNKMDLSKQVSILPASNIEGKTYPFRFLNEDDYYNKLYRDNNGIGYGDYNYEVASTFQKGERVFQLPWAQSVPVEVAGTNIRLPTIITVNPITFAITPFKGKARCFYYQGLKSSDSWVLRNSVTLVGTTLTSYPACSHIDDYIAPTFDWNFGTPSLVYWTAAVYTLNNLFVEYQEKFLKEITGKDSKILRAYFNLNAEDVQAEKLRTFAMINGVLFRKNIISDYSDGLVTTKGELVRILAANKRRNLVSQIPTFLNDVVLLSGGTGGDAGTPISRGGVDSVDISAPVIYG